MKKLLLIFALTFSHFFQINAQKDKLDQLFEKYQEAEGVTSIKIAKPMFNMLNKLNIDDAELSQIKPLLSKINGLKILIVEKPNSNAKPGTEEQKAANGFLKLQSDISASIKNMKYEELITVSSKDNKIKFLSSDATNGILDNLLLSINSEGNQVLMMLDGKISMDDINNLVNEAEKSAPINSVISENISSNGATQVRNVGKFTGISVSGGVKVNFTQGNNQSVVVDTDSDKQKYVLTEVKDGILMISVDYKKNLNFKKLLVTIEAPQLSFAKVSSGSQLSTMNTINEDYFKTEVSSGANLNADLNIKNSVNVDISSGSNAKIEVQSTTFKLEGSSGSMSTITGNAQKAEFDLSSAAACNAQNLEGSEVTAQTSSGSTLKVNVTKSLTANSSSGSSIRYKGNPSEKNSTKESSGGSIKPLN